MKNRSPEELRKINEKYEARLRAWLDELYEELRTLGDDGGDFPPHYTEEEWAEIQKRRGEIIAMIRSKEDILMNFYPPKAKETKREYKGKIY